MTYSREAAVLTVLVVDDEENVISSVKRLLHRIRTEKTGNSYRVLGASNGSEAMQVLPNEKPDCVLLDYRMPGGDGLAWMKRMLAVDPDLAIVMATGEGNEHVAVEAMKNGAMDYLVKSSISAEKLERAIMNAVEKVRMRKAIEQQRQELMDAERQRVMIESLGAACHYLGQPATVIRTYLEMMRKTEKSPEKLKMIEECLEAAGAMSDILHKLQQVSQYRTVPYRPAGDMDGARPATEPPRSDERILKV